MKSKADDLDDYDLNNITKNGVYFARRNVSNAPLGSGTTPSYFFYVLHFNYSGNAVQIAISYIANRFFFRASQDGYVWGTWTELASAT